MSNVKRKHPFWMKAAICCAGYGVMSDGIVIPLLNALLSEYPDTGLFLQNFIISGNTLIALPSCFLTGLLLKRVTKKRLLTFGTALFLVAGLGCAFAPNMLWLGILRGLDSAADGILTVVTSAMIVELFDTEAEQAKLFGWYNAMSCVFSAVITVFAGYAAYVSWRVGFLINGISVISLLLVIFFIPETRITDQPDSREESSIQDWERDLVFRPWDYLFTSLCLLLMYCIQALFMYMCDVYIDEKGFGGSVVTGYLSSGMMIASFVSSLLAAPVLERYHNKSYYVMTIALVCAGTWLFYYFCENVTALFIVTILSCLVQNWMMIYWSLYVSRTVPKKQRGICISIYTALTYLGASLSPYLLNLWEGLFHDGTVTGSCLYGGYLFLIIGGLYFLRGLRSRRHPECL